MKGRKKLTLEEINERIKGWNVICLEWNGIKKLSTFKCKKCGHIIELRISNLNKKGKKCYCDNCSKLYKKERVEKILGDEYEVLEIINRDVKIKHKTCGNIYMKDYGNVLSLDRNNRCSKCKEIEKYNNLINDFIENEYNKDFELLKFFKKNKTFYINCICKKCGYEVSTYYSYFKTNKFKCKKCSNKLRDNRYFGRILTNNEFQNKLDEIHGENNFKLISNYCGSFERIDVKCNKCNYISNHEARYFLTKRFICINCKKKNTIQRSYIKKLKYKEG